MSLRVRLFLLLAGLLALLMGAQWWLIQSLARDLGTEVSAVAFSVGQELVEVIRGSEVELEDSADGSSEKLDFDVRVIQAEEEDPKRVQHIVRIVRSNEAGSLSPEELEEMVIPEALSEPPDLGPHGPGHHGLEPHVLEVLHSKAPGDDVLVLKGPRLMRKIPIPLQSFDLRLDRFRSRLLVGTLALLALGLILAAMVAHRVSRPLRSLATAAQRVGDGELGVRVPEGASGELGATLRAFNLMSSRLARLEADTQRLREARHLTELGEVSQGFAHSLRNPLNALGLSVDTLAEGTVEEDQRLALASTARQQIHRVDGALRSFLALASNGGEPEDVDVGILLQDVALEAIQDCQSPDGPGLEGPGIDNLGGATEKGLAPRLEVLPTTNLPTLKAVAPELRSVLQALVINAMEASPPGGRVTLSAEALSEDRVRILVQDEGPGLPPAVREKLFTPHVTTKAQGSGMGLFLAHRIATSRYEGSLTLEDLSSEGRPSEDAHGGTRAILELSHRLSFEPGADVGGSPHG